MMRWRWLLGSVLLVAPGAARAALPLPPAPPPSSHTSSELGQSHPGGPPVVHGAPLLPLPPRPPGVTMPATRTEAAKPPAAKPEAAASTKAPAANEPQVPYWEALRASEVYLRQGPGMQYPIRWVYHRRGMPVHVLRQFDVWRLVVDPEGERGWMHEATLTRRRGFMVTAKDVLLRAGPSDGAQAVAKLEQGVTGRLRICPAGSWCRVSAGGYDGWVPRAAIFGVEPDEVLK